MPRGIPNQPKAQPPAAPVADSAAPMIIIQPGPAGTRLDAYNLALAEIVDELRRSLIHLVATNAGCTVISHDIPRAAAIVAHPSAPPSRNGSGPKPAPARKPLRQPAGHDLDDDDAL